MHLRVWEKLSLQELLGLNATLHTYLKGGRLCLQKNLLIQAAYYELIRGFLTAGRENNLICSSRKGLLRLYQGSDLCSEESLHREPNLRSVYSQSARLNPEATCNSRLREPYSLVIKRRLKVSDQINVQKLLRASAASASLALPPCNLTSVTILTAMETHWWVNVNRYAKGIALTHCKNKKTAWSAICVMRNRPKHRSHNSPILLKKIVPKMVNQKCP